MDGKTGTESLPLFRIRYAEKVGTGTTDMISDCQAAGLTEPDFEQRGPHFVVTLQLQHEGV